MQNANHFWFDVQVLIYKGYKLLTWNMLEKQGDHIFFIKFPPTKLCVVGYDILLILSYFRRKTRTRTKFLKHIRTTSVYAPPF